jgi:hypothetical protein
MYRGVDEAMKRRSETVRETGTDGCCAHEFNDLLLAHVGEHRLVDLGATSDLFQRLDKRLLSLER